MTIIALDWMNIKVHGNILYNYLKKILRPITINVTKFFSNLSRIYTCICIVF